MIRCIVIDDEPLAVKLLSNYVNEHEDLHLSASYHDPIKAFHELDSDQIDLIFLDIQMPQLSGIQFLKLLKDRTPVILTTAYNEYALESYEYQVIDYLVKPISFERFSKSIAKFQAYHSTQNLDKKGSKNKTIPDQSIFIKSGHKTIRIDLDKIKFLESRGDYLHIITETEQHRTLENLKDIITRLSTNFLRCHRSFVVNMNKMNFIENNRIIIDDNYIPISRAYLEEVHSYVRD